MIKLLQKQNGAVFYASQYYRVNVSQCRRLPTSPACRTVAYLLTRRKHLLVVFLSAPRRLHEHNIVGIPNSL